jgi:3-keto-L-gulonate-6-phosphate decarboxylase
MAVGIAKFDVNDIIDAGQRRLREAEDTGADAMVVSCAGCYWLLSMMKVLSGSDLPIYHIIEIVQMASGEQPVHRVDERAQSILEIIGRELGDVIFMGDKTLLESKYWMKEVGG